MKDQYENLKENAILQGNESRHIDRYTIIFAES